MTNQINRVYTFHTFAPVFCSCKDLMARVEKSKALSHKPKLIAFLFKVTKMNKQLSKTKKTSKCEKREVFDRLLASLWRIHVGPIYTTRHLSLYNSFNQLLLLYNSNCDLYGLYLTIFIYLNS
jgi:hypothetical protein